jgi:hypothetical protein
MMPSTSSVAACRSEASLSSRCASASRRSRSLADSCAIAAIPCPQGRRGRVEILRDARKPLNGLDILVLFDHLVGAGEQSRRDGEAERLSGEQIDDEIEFGRLLDWDVGRLGPTQNLDDITSRAPVQV